MYDNYFRLQNRPANILQYIVLHNSTPNITDSTVKYNENDLTESRKLRGGRL